MIRARLLGYGLIVFGALVPVCGQECAHSNDPVYYSDRKYIVRKAEVKSPFDFVSAVKAREAAAEKQLPLGPEKVFTNEDYSKGVGILRQFFAFSGFESPLKFRVILPALWNCDESVNDNASHGLDVIYQVFLSNPFDYLYHPSEYVESRIAQPSSTVATSIANWRIAPSGTVAYNRAIGVSGGGSLGVALPQSWGTLHAQALESTAAHRESANWTTSRNFGANKLDSLNLRFGYQHSDQPSDSARLKSANLFVQGYGTSHPSSLNNVSVRYGADFEGGNEQSLFIDTKVIPDVVPASSYAGLKAYLGLNIFREDSTISASYAFQVATNGNLGAVSFLKHIGYLYGTTEFPVRGLETSGDVHRPISVEFGVAGGFLQRLNTMPVSQRFFGGNIEPHFIAGDDWKILGGPFIRSIPENRLNAFGVYGEPVGGSSFWSSNITVALPIWGRPLVPKELETNPTFEPAIKAEKTAAQNALTLTYQKDLPAFKNFVSHIPLLDTELSQLKSVLSGITQELSAAVGASLASSKSATESAIRVCNEVQTSTPQAASALVVGPVSRLSKLSTALERLERGLADAGENEAADTVHARRENILRLQSSLADEIQKIDLTIPQQRAADELEVVDPVLDALLHKLNIISISPIAVFDCARLWPDAKGTRFGPGAGVRLSLVTLNVNLGYAWNVGGAKPEGPGAIFFSLDVSNFFR